MVTIDTGTEVHGTDGQVTDVPPLDEARVGGFVDDLLGWYTASFVTFMVDLGHRTGLFAAATQGRCTSDELAARAGLRERYVREWLGAMVTAGVFDYEPAASTYHLPAEHAVCLTGGGETDVSRLSQISGHLAKFIEPVAEAFRRGGGVPYAAYRPEFTDLMDGLNRPLFDQALVDVLVPLAPDLLAALTAGVRAADVGCGTGHSTNLLAQAFPASQLVGYDLAGDAIDRGRAEARAMGLTNASFEVLDVAELEADPPLGAAFAFDAIHDQADPGRVLARIHQALAPGGVFFMVDVRASSRLERNVGNPLAPWLYGVSTLHCMTVSLAEGGAGLGTAWGEELALDMLAEAGFVGVEVNQIPGDPVDSLYVCRKQR